MPHSEKISQRRAYSADSGPFRPPIPEDGKKWTDISGFAGRIVPDWVDAYFRIHWTLCARLRSRLLTCLTHYVTFVVRQR